MSEHDATTIADGADLEEEPAQIGGADAPVAPAIDENASFGIEEGEVDQLERKWITWCVRRARGRQDGGRAALCRR